MGVGGGKRTVIFLSVTRKKCAVPVLFHECVLNAQQAKSSFVTLRLTDSVRVT